MKILFHSRAFTRKAVSLIQGLNLSNRVVGTTFVIPKRTQQSLSSQDKDAPIEIENPFTKERVSCILCKHDIEPDYKNVRLLSQFQSRFTGRIYGRHITGLCKHKQDRVEREIQKAQHAGLMPYYHKEIKYVNDPKLFNIDNPFRPHKY